MNSNKRQVSYNGGNHDSGSKRYGGSSSSNYGNKENYYPSGRGGVGHGISEHQAKQVLNRIVRCNTLTISSAKSPEYYLQLIRYHFMHNSQQENTLILQALGLSCQNLIFVACLVTLKGYATYKKIKNDHLSVPVADSRTGSHLGLVKKVRLTVKLLKAENF